MSITQLDSAVDVSASCCLSQDAEKASVQRNSKEILSRQQRKTLSGIGTDMIAICSLLQPRRIGVTVHIL